MTHLSDQVLEEKSRRLDDDDQRKKNVDDYKVKLPSPSFRRLLALNLPEWKQASFGCLSAIFSGAVQPVFGPLSERLRQSYNFSYMGEHLTKRIRERVFSKILTFEVGWFDQEDNSSGAAFSRLAKDANVGRSLVGDRMSLIVQTVSAVAIAFTMGLVIAWRFALVMMAVQPLIIVCFYSRKVLLKNMSKKAKKAQDESSKLAAEAVSNLRTITAFSSQDRILKRLEKAQEWATKRECSTIMVCRYRPRLLPEPVILHLGLVFLVRWQAHERGLHHFQGLFADHLNPCEHRQFSLLLLVVPPQILQKAQML
ncbi:hypothetical protein Pint_19365 [Pistacia integerrima]|uniref:Uncharacterized protein n=1 Tax=Pistacia integerrima TaxID=434235 RepID=A0ACC0YZH6_9ROSI|nr:hypothetical protein Pint_19365 [Pistacia integerrima]